MKRIIVLAILAMLLIPATALAGNQWSVEYYGGVGFRYEVHPQIHLHLNKDKAIKDVEVLPLRSGLTYTFPRNLLIWQFYAGSGLEYRWSAQTIDPYLIFGSNFLIFFSEGQYTFGTNEPTFRGGLRIRF